MEGQLAPVAIDALIARRAEPQHGVVGRHQLRELGMSAKAVDHRIKEGRLHPVHRGVYAVGHRRIIVKGRWMAAVLACGPRAALSHTGAAAFYDLRAVPSGPVHVTVPTRSGLASRPGITVHRSRLAAGEAVVIDAVRVTTVSRTLLDLGDVLTLRALRNTLRRAEVLELFDLAALQTQIARHRHRAGAAVLKHALGHIAATATPADRNWLERRLAAICHKHGLPLPEQQVMIGPHTVDFLWREQRLVVETDGWEHHGTRAAFEADRSRDAELTMAGYRLVRFTYAQLKHEPDRVARTLSALLG